MPEPREAPRATWGFECRMVRDIPKHPMRLSTCDQRANHRPDIRRWLTIASAEREIAEAIPMSRHPL